MFFCQVIIGTNVYILNEARKKKFIADYAQWIQSNVKFVDNLKHNKTTNIRHMKRVTNRAVEHFLENLPEIVYVTKKQQEYQVKMIKI